MAKRVRFTWDISVFEEIRRSPGVQQVVTKNSAWLAKRANTNSVPSAKYGYSTRQGKTRFRGIVFTDNYKARVDNAKNNTLLKLL